MGDEIEIMNAKIEGTDLGRESHGTLTFWLRLDYGGTGQGFGGYGLDGVDKDGEDKRTYGSMEIISRILEVVGVENWEDLIGKYVRVKKNGYFGPIIEIGNVLKEDWLNLEEFFR